MKGHVISRKEKNKDTYVLLVVKNKRWYVIYVSVLLYLSSTCSRNIVPLKYNKESAVLIFSSQTFDSQTALKLSSSSIDIHFAKTVLKLSENKICRDNSFRTWTV